MNRNEQLEAVEALLLKFDARLSRAFLESVEKVQDAIPLSQVENFLRQGNYSSAVAMVNDALVAAGFTTFSRALQDALIAGGDYAALIANASKIEFGFQISESNVARFMSQYQADKIIQISADMRATVTQIINREVTAGTNPKETARRFKQGLGLTKNQETAVANYRRRLETQSAEALSYRLRDKRYDPTVARMIKDGKPIPKEKIDAMVDAYRRKYVARRALTIAQTESITMNSAGSDAYWRQLIDTGTVLEEEIIGKWIVTRDSKLRDAHAGIPALNPQGRRIGEPFLSSLGPIYYPGDPTATAANRINCRCARFMRIERV